MNVDLKNDFTHMQYISYSPWLAHIYFFTDTSTFLITLILGENKADDSNEISSLIWILNPYPANIFCLLIF